MHRPALVSASLALIAVAMPAMANEDVLRQTAKPEQWVLQTGDYANQRYTKLDQINRDNVKNLKVAWTFSTGVLRGHEGSPLVVGDIMYVHTPFPNIVYALDLNEDGKILWKYEPKQDPSVIPVMCCDTVYRGLAYADGTIYHHQADTTLVALDAKTGKEKWKVVNGDPKKGETNTATVLPVKDKVIVGISGAEFGVRGHVTAYDAKTGRQVWRAYTLGPDNETLFDPEKTMSLGKPVGKDSSLKTWNGEQWKIGGGTAWGWFSYDPETNLFFYGTANPSTWNPVQRAGPDGKPIDQKWTMAIIARDADTGMAKWAYQMTPFDEWDFDGVNEMILADINIGVSSARLSSTSTATVSATRSIALRASCWWPKNSIPRSTGPPASSWTRTARNMGARRSSRSTRRSRPARTRTPRVSVRQRSAARTSSPRHSHPGPTCSMCRPTMSAWTTSRSGSRTRRASPMSAPRCRCSRRPAATAAWATSSPGMRPRARSPGRSPEKFSVWSGALATAGGIVFYGTLEGYLKAVDEKDGKELFKFKTPSGIIGNVMSFSHNGKQYVAVLSGVGGWAGIGLAAGLTNPTDGLGAVGGYAALRDYTALGGSLTVFTLP